MFEELTNRVWRVKSEFDLQLTMCFDPYRLEHLCAKHAEDMGHFMDEAKQMVKELEVD